MNETDFDSIEPNVSESHALLLSDSSFIRFVPDDDWRDTTAFIRFRAWDQTVGSSGDYETILNYGGIQPFSEDFDSGFLV